MIEKAKISDLPEILQVQKQAFQPVAVVENNDRLPPLVQTLQEITVEYDRRLFLKYILDGKIVGSVRAHLDENCICQIGKLVVLPQYQFRGIGAALMEAIEREFEDSNGYELFTGSIHEKTVAFYHRLGYKTTRTTIMDGVCMEFMRKDRYRTEATSHYTSKWRTLE